MKEGFTIIYPNGKGMRRVEKEEQLLNKKLPLLQKKQKKGSIRSFNFLLLSLGDALKWPVIKSKLNVPVLWGLTKKRWPVIAFSALMLLFFFRNDNNQIVEIDQIATEQANEASLLPLHKENHAAVPPPASARPQLVSSRENQKPSDFEMPVIPEAKRTDNMILRELGGHAASIRNAYIQRFAKLAQTEAQKYGIPASVILGLAILQSEFGTYILAEEGHNHFRITCDQNPIRIGSGMIGQGVHYGICYTRYENDWTGFRAHSKYLISDFDTPQSDSYKVWARALEKAGYFKGRYNADALLATIKAYELDEFDQQHDAVN